MELLHNIFITWVLYSTITVSLNDINYCDTYLSHDIKFLISPIPDCDCCLLGLLLETLSRYVDALCKQRVDS